MPKLEWFQQRFTLDDAAAAKIVQRCHVIFSQSVENMEPKLQWLQQRLGLDHFPPLLGDLVRYPSDGADCCLNSYYVGTLDNRTPLLSGLGY